MVTDVVCQLASWLARVKVWGIPAVFLSPYRDITVDNEQFLPSYIKLTA